MDLFNILAKGATMNRSQKSELRKLAGNPEAARTLDVSHKVNFFSKPTPREKAVAAPKLRHQEAITSKEDAAAFRRAHRIKVTGDTPLPITAFQDLRERYSVDERLLDMIERLEYTKPTAIQSEAIPIIMEGHDLLACAPTGSGKTLGFVVPLIQKLIELKKLKNEMGPTALIVSPTRELANQIYAIASQLARGHPLQVALMNKKQLAKLRNNNAGSKQKMDLVVATPLRLVEGAREGLYTLENVQFLVLDECDKLLGEGFVEQTDQVFGMCTNSHIVKAVFSATMPSNVEQLAHSVMTAQPCRVIVGHKEGAADSVEQSLTYCGSEAGKLTAMRQLLAGGRVTPPILVFVQSIQRAKALFHELLYDKANVDVIHSELAQAQRERVINQFKRGEVWVLICTDVLARGIDFQGVNLVVNYDVPLTAQAYVHRIGRTGRAGREGRAVTFYTNQDVQALRPVINVMRQSGVPVSEWLVRATHKRRHDQPVHRTGISTVPGVIRRERKQRQQMIDASKRRSKL